MDSVALIERYFDNLTDHQREQFARLGEVYAEWNQSQFQIPIKEYEKLGPNATNCVECGNGEGHCPQKIGIIKKLKDIHKKYEELKEKKKNYR